MSDKPKTKLGWVSQTNEGGQRRTIASVTTNRWGKPQIQFAVKIGDKWFNQYKMLLKANDGETRTIDLNPYGESLFFTDRVNYVTDEDKRDQAVQDFVDQHTGADDFGEDDIPF